MRIVISSGHALHVRGASGALDEVDEARKVVERTADYLRLKSHTVTTFHDDTSTTQDQNLQTIVDFHNAQERDLDISVHFNAYQPTSDPMGTEVLYTTQEELADKVSMAISKSGELINRGAKHRSDLYFLNKTEEPAILIETCFVDSSADAQNYRARFDPICMAIASVGEQDIPDKEPERDKEGMVSFEGACSWFGGPDDTGVSPSEGLAFIYEIDEAPHLFLDQQPSGTTGLARRLDPDVFYVACRWNYDVTPKDMLSDHNLVAVVHSPKTGLKFPAWPADWGPHEDTDRAADISPGLMKALGIDTDDEVVVTYPFQIPKPAPKPQPEPVAATPPPPPAKKSSKPKKSKKTKK